MSVARWLVGAASALLLIVPGLTGAASGELPIDSPWPVSTQLTQSDENQRPDVAVGPNGLATAVWKRQQGGQWVVQARSQTAADFGPTGNFGPVVNLSSPGQVIDTPRIVIEPDGTTTVVWLAGSGSAMAVKAATRGPGESSFGAASDLSTGSFSNLRVAASAGGTVVAWRRHASGTQYDFEMRVRRPGGSFGSTVKLNVGGQTVDKPEISIGPDGTIAAAWVSNQSAIMTGTLSPEEDLRTTTTIETSGNGRHVGSPTVATGPGGSLAVAWASTETATGTTLARVRMGSAGRSFGETVQLNSANGLITQIQAAIAGDGTVGVAWRQNGVLAAGQNGVLAAAVKNPDGGFSAPIYLSQPGGAFDPFELTAGPLGNLAIAWQTTAGGQSSVAVASRPRGGNSFIRTQMEAPPASASFPSVALGKVGGPVTVWQRSSSTGSQVDLLDGGVPMFLENSGPGEGRIQVEPTGVDCGSVCSTRVQPGGTVTLHAKPAPGSVLAGWIGGCLGRSRTCEVTIDQPRMIHPIFTEDGIHLSATRSGEGSGSIASDGPEIDCGDDCEDYYLPGDRVILTAEPEPGNTFVGWSGDCSGETMKCLVEIGEESMEVDAEFAPSLHMPDWIRPSLGTPGGSDVADLSLTATGPDGIPTLLWQRREPIFTAIQLVQAEGVRFDTQPRYWPSQGLNLSEVPDDPVMAESPDGTMVVAWTNDTSSQRTFQLSTRPPGGDFGPVETIAIGTEADLADLAVEAVPGGTLVTWRRKVNGKFRLEMRHRPPGDQFGFIQVVSATGDDVSEPQMAAAPSGKVGFAWLDLDGPPMLQFREWFPDTRSMGGFSVGLLGAPLKPVLAYGSQSEAILAYLRGDAGQAQVEAVIKPPGTDSQTGFSPPNVLSAVGQDISRPRLAVSAEGAVAATWRRSGHIEAAARDRGQASFGPTQLLAGKAPNNTNSIGPPSIAASTEDEFAVVWKATSEMETRVWSATRPSGGEFAPPTVVVTDEPVSTDPQVAFDPDQNLLVAWLHPGTSELDGKIRTVTRPPKVVREIEIAGEGSPGGRVRSDPSGIDCGYRCSHDFYAGTRVVLTAEPSPGHVFLGWAGDRCDGWSGQCVLRMDGDHRVRPIFAEGHRLTVSKRDATSSANTGRGRIISESGIDCGAKCQATVQSGEEVTLKAYGDATSVFVGWGGACTGSAPTCTVTMDQARDVEARFAEGVALTVRSRGGGLGAVTSDPAWTPCFIFCTGTFTRDTIVNLTADSKPGYAFDRWSGDCSGSTPTCRLTMDREAQVSSHFEPGHELTVSKSGDGDGTVASAPQRIDCGASCSESFVTGTVVTLTAQPDSRSVFMGWSGACSGTGPECIVTVDQAREVDAEFFRWSQLDVNRTGGGQGAVRSDLGGIECGADCGHLFPPGTEVELTADPAPGHAFVGWDGACEGSSPTCSVTLAGDAEVSARFEPILGLTVTKAGPGQGRVTSTPGSIDCGATCTTEVNGVTEVTLRAEPEPGSAFVAWGGACTGTGLTCTVTVDQEKAVTATFSPGHTIAVLKAGAGTGVVTSTPARIECGSDCEFAFAENTSVTLRAAPDPDNAFVKWSGACAGARLTCTVTVSQARNVTASFAPGHVLDVESRGPTSGHVVSDPERISCGDACAQAFSQGTEVTLTAVPAPGSAFVTWDGACAGARLSCTVTMDQAREVAANFSWGKHLVVTKAGSGSGAVTSDPERLDCGAVCEETFPYQALVALTAVPDAESVFVRWNGVCKGVSTTCVVPMVGDRSATAIFEPKPPTWPLSVSRSGSGLGKVVSAPAGIDCDSDCEAPYPDGTVVTLSAEAATGSRFTGFSGDCQGTGPTCRVTLSEARDVDATFERFHMLRVSRAGGGHGTITSGPGGISCGTVCEAKLQSGTRVEITARPGSTNYFVGWTGACEGSDPVCSLSIDSERQATARFERLAPVIVATAGKGAGRVTSQPAGIDCGDRCAEAFLPDKELTLTAQPAAGNLFAGWTGACEGQGPTCVISPGTSTEARFVPASRLSLDVIGSGGGMVRSEPSGISCAGSCASEFATGTEVTLHAVPEAGSHLAGWSGGCEGSDAECVVALAESRSVTATFDADPEVCAPTQVKVGPALPDRKQKFLTTSVRTGQPGRIVTGESPTLHKTVVKVGPSGSVRFKVRIKPGVRARLRKRGRTLVGATLAFHPDTGCAKATRRISFVLRHRITSGGAR